MQQGSPGKDDPPQESSIHVSHAQTKKGFRRKKGENPIEIQADIKMKKVKRQSNYTNPDAWARLIGRTNTALIYLEVRAHQVIVEDLGEDLEDFRDKICHGKSSQNLFLISPHSMSKETPQRVRIVRIVVNGC